jgi:hypothetical protein
LKLSPSAKITAHHDLRTKKLLPAFRLGKPNVQYMDTPFYGRPKLDNKHVKKNTIRNQKTMFGFSQHQI